MRYILTLFLLPAVLPVICQSPNTSDCAGAIIICDTSYVQVLGQPEVNSIPNEVNTFTTCLTQGEIPGRWYRFAPADTGMLSFNIIPADTAADYDWVLYDLDGSNCTNVSSDPALLRACNFSGILGNTGITGANGGNGPADEPVIQADSAHQYYLYIASYAGDFSGYTISFSGSTVSLLDCQAVGTEETAGTKITLYPNPADEWISVAGIQGAEKITLYDVNGRTVRTALVNGNQHVENISALPGGLYFVHVTFPGKTQTLKYIKN